MDGPLRLEETIEKAEEAIIAAYRSKRQNSVEELNAALDLLQRYFRMKINDPQFQAVQRAVTSPNIEDLLSFVHVPALTTKQVDEIKSRINSYYDSISIFSKPTVEQISSAVKLKPDFVRGFLIKYGKEIGLREGLYTLREGKKKRQFNFWARDPRAYVERKIPDLIENKGYVVWQDVLDDRSKVVGDFNLKASVATLIGMRKSQYDFWYGKRTVPEQDMVYTVELPSGQIYDDMEKKVASIVQSREEISLTELQAATNLPRKHIASVMVSLTNYFRKDYQGEHLFVQNGDLFLRKRAA